MWSLPPFGPDLRVLHVGGYWRGPNDTVRHMMLGLQQAGVDVVELCTDDHPEALDTDGRAYDRGNHGPVWLRYEVVEPVIAQHDPHLVVCNSGGLSFRPADADLIRRSRALLGIALSDPAVFEQTTSRIAPTFDRFITNHPGTVPRYRQLGVSTLPLRFGTNPDFFHPVLPDPDLVCDVLVMGHAHADRVEVVRALDRAFDTHVYGEGWDSYGIRSRGLVFGERSLAALASAGCVVVFHRGLDGDVLVKPSLFDFTAAGALVVTNRDVQVAEYFRFDEELVGFETTTDLVETIRRFLDDPDAADRVRAEGRQRTLRDHTWASAWRSMLTEPV